MKNYSPGFNCNSCGTSLSFQYESGIYLVCSKCGSFTERNSTNKSEKGKLPPEDLTLIQIGTRGKWNETSFEVTGRIRFELEDDSYANWWHLESGQSSFGWMAESYANFRLMRPATLKLTFAEIKKLSPGNKIRFKEDEAFTLGTFASAKDCSAEGELPVIPESKKLMWLDLSSETNKSIDIHIFSADEISFYKGEDISFEKMSLTNIRKADGWIG